MKYLIPLNKIDTLKKIINKYQRKGAYITFVLGEEVVCKGTLHIRDDKTRTETEMPINVKCIEVEVEGTYIINGWQFVGTIQFTELGNVIRLADSSFENRIPEKYYHTPMICEHCGKIRNRKDTYLIYNIDNNEFKQVGSSCLLDYTKGLDANECAAIMACLDFFSKLSDCNFDFKEMQNNNYTIDKVIKNYAITLVNKYGYTKTLTAKELSDFYSKTGEDWEERFGSLVLAKDEEVAKIDEFAKQYIDSYSNEYMRNASITWLKKEIEYRDLGLLCSFVFTYNKEMKTRKEKMESINNEWVGNIGDRITINIQSFRLLFKSETRVAYNTYADIYTYEIIDNENHTFIWKSSKEIEYMYIFNETRGVDIYTEITPTEIVATVKSHSTYKNIKQTIITRGKVTKYVC